MEFRINILSTFNQELDGLHMTLRKSVFPYKNSVRIFWKTFRKHCSQCSVTIDSSAESSMISGCPRQWPHCCGRTVGLNQTGQVWFLLILPYNQGFPKSLSICLGRKRVSYSISKQVLSSLIFSLTIGKFPVYCHLVTFFKSSVTDRKNQLACLHLKVL